MRRIAAFLVLLALVPGLLSGCGVQDAPVSEVVFKTTPAEEPIAESVEVEARETIPDCAAHIKGIEQYLDPVDYSDPNNWVSLPETVDKPVDVIYLYPTVYGTVVTVEDDLSHVDDMSMRIGAIFSAATQASVFEENCNLFIPYYRQFTVEALLDMNDNHPDALDYCVSQDIYDMLDYYFENRNEDLLFLQGIRRDLYG